MTYYCTDCVMNWHPFHCNQGACPECGGGTRRSYDPASPDAEARHQLALAAAIKRDRYVQFEAYYAEHEQRHPAAA